MKALCWNGIGKLSVESVRDPEIINPHDVIVRVTMSSINGADIHAVNGFLSTMEEGDIIGHEFTGTIVETGSAVSKVKAGDRVVVGPVIGCGECSYCANGLWSLCDNSNPNADLQQKVYGAVTAGVFGFSHAFGGYPGSHAEYIRVPFADCGAFGVPDELRDEQAVFASGALSAGFMSADIADIRPGDTVAVWGCGGVGLMALQSAVLLGAGRVIGIDRFPMRLNAAREMAGAEVMDYTKVDVHEMLMEMTGGRGPDRCIDAVGMEANSTGNEYRFDHLKQKLRLQSDHCDVLQEIITACRKGGTVSIAGVYHGRVNRFPIGAAMSKGLNIRMGFCSPQKYIPIALDHMVNHRIDPSYLLTHRLPLERAPEGVDLLNNKKHICLRAVLTPNHC